MGSCGCSPSHSLKVRWRVLGSSVWESAVCCCASYTITHKWTGSDCGKLLQTWSCDLTVMSLRFAIDDFNFLLFLYKISADLRRRRNYEGAVIAQWHTFAVFHKLATVSEVLLNRLGLLNGLLLLSSIFSHVWSSVYYSQFYEVGWATTFLFWRAGLFWDYSYSFARSNFEAQKMQHDLKLSRLDNPAPISVCDVTVPCRHAMLNVFDLIFTSDNQIYFIFFIMCSFCKTAIWCNFYLSIFLGPILTIF